MKYFHFHPFGRADVEPSRMPIWSSLGRRSWLPYDGIYVHMASIEQGGRTRVSLHPSSTQFMMYYSSSTARGVCCFYSTNTTYLITRFFSHHRRIKFHYQKEKKLQKFNDPKCQLQELVDGYSRHPSTVKLLATLAV